MTWRPAIWLVAIGAVTVDQVSKQWALNSLEPYVLHPVLGEWLGIELVFNSGAASSFGEDSTWLLTIVAIVVSAAIVYYARRAQKTWAVWMFGIAMGGAIGNLTDRLFRQPSFGQGHVVDFINYGNQFVGNIADIAIVGAAVALVSASVLGKEVLAPLTARGASAKHSSQGSTTVESSTDAGSSSQARPSE